MPVNRVLHSFSNVLRSNAANPNHYAMSQCVGRIDTFISHTWSTPGHKKFLVLAFHYNVVPALLITVLVASTVCCLTAKGLLPSVMVVEVATQQDAQFHRGLLCLPVGLVTFFVSLCILHELDRFWIPWRRDKVFLDVTCVHQTDMDLKRKGIESLAAFLDRSNELLVIYSDNYLRRLWTVYEVASWLVLRRGKRMTVRPVFAPGPVLGGVLAFALFQVVWFAMGALRAQNTRSFETMSPSFVLLMGFATAIPVYTVAAWLGGVWASSLEMMEAHVAKFRLRDAQCSREADRELVIKNISAFMKLSQLVEPGASEEQICESFEALVRQEVPSLIRESLGRVGIPYSWVAVLPLSYLLVAFDRASGWWLDGRSANYAICWSLSYLVMIFGLFPLIVAALIHLGKRPGLRRFPAYLLMAVASLAFSLGMHSVFGFLERMSDADKRWLLPLLSIYAALAFPTVLLYRPLRAGSPAPQGEGAAAREEVI